MTPPPDPERFDLLVVGGGVNGVGIARDAAGRGLSVVLSEQHDLAAHTSSSSTKLIHGGLRYLEQYDFGLVRKSLREREVLLKSAPHIMWPLRFLMPHDPSMRPAWMIRLGLLFYDHLAHRDVLPGSTTVDLRHHPAGDPLRERFTRGFVYSDGWVDDARLVVLCAVDAAQRGARVLTRTRCVEARRAADGWHATLRGDDGKPRHIVARALVNAAGPWAEHFLREGAGQHGARGLRLVKGSHIVVPRLFDHDMAYILQSPDKRIVFAIPYEQDYTLVGTTDVELAGDPGAACITAQETDYLCGLINRYFTRPISPTDVIWSYSGVRPLLGDESDDPSAVTREYTLELDTEGPPLLSIWGGKITTFRKLAEEAIDLLLPPLGERRPAWTAGAWMPGGDFASSPEASLPARDFERFLAEFGARHPWLPSAMVRRWARGYGTRSARIVGPARSLSELGIEVAPGLHEAELDYLARDEWARTGEDVLWRRTKLGLHLDAKQRAAVDGWMQARARQGLAA